MFYSKARSKIRPTDRQVEAVLKVAAYRRYITNVDGACGLEYLLKAANSQEVSDFIGNKLDFYVLVDTLATRKGLR